MAFTHVQTSKQSPTVATTANGTTSISETFGSTPAVGDLVLVLITYFHTGGPTLSGVTDNQSPHNTWDPVITVNDVNNNVHAALYSTVVTQASGTFTVTANFSAASDACIGITQHNASAGTPAVDGSASTIGTTTAPTSSSLTPSQANNLFISLISDDDANQTYTIPSGWGVRAQNVAGATSMVLGSASLIAADSAAKQAVWSIGFANWVCLIATFKEVPPTTPLVGAIAGQSTIRAQLSGIISKATQGFFDKEALNNKAWFLPEASTPKDVFFDLIYEDAVAASGALVGAISGQSLITAELSLRTALTGAIVGQSNLAANLGIRIPLVGAIAGQSALAAALTERVALVGAISGQAALAAALTERVALTGAIAGQSNLTASLGELIALVGAISGQSTLSANLSELIALIGALSGQSILSADLSLDIPGGVNFTALIQGQSTITAELSLRTALVGAIAGQSNLAASLSEQVALVGAIAGQSNLIATLSERIALAGAIAGQSNITAALLERVALTAAINGKSTLAAVLSGFGSGGTVIYHPIYIFED